MTGVHFNLENLIRGYWAAEDKTYAICCTIPYLQFFLMMFASSFSQLFAQYPVYFLILCGFHLTWVTAIFNLCSTAKSKFDWIFAEPILFFICVGIDYF